MKSPVSAETLHKLIQLSKKGQKVVDFEVDGQPKRMRVGANYAECFVEGGTELRITYFTIILPNMLHATVWFPYERFVFKWGDEVHLGLRMNFKKIDKIKFIVDKRCSLDDVLHYFTIILLTVKEDDDDSV